MVILENPQSKETLQAVESWIVLKGERARDRAGPTSKNRVGNVLRFLGLPYENERQLRVKKKGNSNRWVHFTFKTDSNSVEGVKGFPLYGSQAQGTYHIFCFWEDARPDRVRQNPSIQRLAPNGQTGVIVLYLNTLTDAERQDIRRDSWTQDITIACLTRSC